jgi:hypothetical protein
MFLARLWRKQSGLILNNNYSIGEIMTAVEELQRNESDFDPVSISLGGIAVLEQLKILINSKPSPLENISIHTILEAALESEREELAEYRKNMAKLTKHVQSSVLN